MKLAAMIVSSLCFGIATYFATHSYESASFVTVGVYWFFLYLKYLRLE